MPYYYAVLTLDYNTPHDNNAYTRLLNALGQVGWEYAETSAMVLADEPNLDRVRLGLEILARAAASPGQVSALTLQVQLVGGADRQIPGAANHRQALNRLSQLPLPSESN